MTCIFIFAILFPTISMSDPQSIPVRATLLPCYRWRNSPQKLTDLIPKSIFHELHRSVRLGMTLDPKVATDAILGTTDRYASFYALIGDFIWFGHWSISVSRSFCVVAMGWKIQHTKHLHVFQLLCEPVSPCIAKPEKPLANNRSWCALPLHGSALSPGRAPGRPRIPEPVR